MSKRKLSILLGDLFTDAALILGNVVVWASIGVMLAWRG